MDEREAWQAERSQVIRAQRIEREEAIERRQQEARQADRQAGAEAAMHARQLSGEPVPSLGDILSRARSLAEAAGPARVAGAEYGSQARPAMFASRPDGSLIEMTARPPAGVARSAPEIRDAELLARAAAVGNDSFMALEVARWERRRRGEAEEASRVRRGGKAAVSRQESGTGWPVISR